MRKRNWQKSVSRGVVSIKAVTWKLLLIRWRRDNNKLSRKKGKLIELTEHNRGMRIHCKIIILTFTRIQNILMMGDLSRSK